MRLSLTNLVCVLFDPAIPTSFFNFIQLFLYLYLRREDTNLPLYDEYDAVLSRLPV